MTPLLGTPAVMMQDAPIGAAPRQYQIDESRLAQAVAAVMGDAVSVVTRMIRDNPVLIANIQTIESVIERLLSGGGAPSTQVQEMLRLVIEDLAIMGAIDVSAEIAGAVDDPEVPVARTLRDTAMIRVADAEVYERVAGRIMQQSAQAMAAPISRTVIRGLAAGLSDAAVATMIQRELPATMAQYAATYATTEATRFYTLGRTLGIEAADDFVWGYRYVVIVDDRTTDICRRYADAMVEKSLMAAWPPFHWNCRTTVVAVMQSEYGGPDNPTTTQLPDGPGPMEGFGVNLRQELAA